MKLSKNPPKSTLLEYLSVKYRDNSLKSLFHSKTSGREIEEKKNNNFNQSRSSDAIPLPRVRNPPRKRIYFHALVVVSPLTPRAGAGRGIGLICAWLFKIKSKRPLWHRDTPRLSSTKFPFLGRFYCATCCPVCDALLSLSRAQNTRRQRGDYLLASARPRSGVEEGGRNGRRVYPGQRDIWIRIRDAPLD